MKFQRTYSMTVQTLPLGVPNNAVTINYPLTCEFEIIRSTLASANTGRFRIYNLKEETRRKIFHDRYDTLTKRYIRFNAGYVDQRPLPLAFVGDIREAYSQRQGANWITTIEAFDGGWSTINSQINKTFPTGVQTKDVLKVLVGALQQVTPGAIGDFSADSARGKSLSGNVWALINNLVGPNGNAFIDNEKVNVLGQNEYIAKAGGILVIDSNTGLLGTPRRHQNVVDVDMIFEPRLAVAQGVKLISEERVYNAFYKVLGISHRGMISGAMDGGVVTTGNLTTGTSALKAVNPQ